MTVATTEHGVSNHYVLVYCIVYCTEHAILHTWMGLSTGKNCYETFMDFCLSPMVAAVFRMQTVQTVAYCSTLANAQASAKNAQLSMPTMPLLSKLNILILVQRQHNSC